MFNLSENYYLRDFYFRREQVPTLSMITKKMTPPLAAVYFKSMRPKIKVTAGLEPLLKGGGTDWYVSPKELLKGRTVLKPIRKEVLCKLNHQGIETIGTTVLERSRKAMDLKIEQELLDADIDWKRYITGNTRLLWDDLVVVVTKKNSEQIRQDYNDFMYFYRRSIGKIEILFHESAIREIKNTKEKALHEMQNKYAAVLEHQATLLYDQYEKKFMEKKLRLRTDFMQKLETNHTAMADKIHDLNVDKHMAVEKLRQCLQCQNLACRMYVAFKEREKCLKETEGSKDTHEKKVKIMTDTIPIKDFEIHQEQEQEKKRQEFCKIWQKKVCHVVKSFQMFASYCINMLPEHAEFFINMEKLMLLQVNEALEDPTAASIIELENEQIHTPVPRPKPFYLFCDRGYKAKVEQDLCPKHSGTSSASGLPVMIINERCLYAACDNFDQFTNKINEFILGNRGDDADFKNDLVYEHFVPVKYGSSQRLLELKLESSLLQVLQQEIENIQTDESKVPIKCKDCELPWCVCPSHLTSVDGGEKAKVASSLITSPMASHHKLQSIGRSVELDHERGPKWDSFCTYVEPKKCSCAKTVKKHLAKHLPVYMRHMRNAPEISGYETCSIKMLKTLVKKARKEIYPMASAEFPAKKDMGTQYFDLEFQRLCTCFSNLEVTSLPIDPTKPTFKGMNTGKDDSVSSTYLSKRTSSFAISRAHSLLNLIKEFPEIKEIFSRKDCAFE